MMQESEIRKMKSDLITAIEYENKSISSKQQEIDESKERIIHLQGRLKVIDDILKDS